MSSPNLEINSNKFCILLMPKTMKALLILPTPQASSNSFSLKLSGPTFERNKNAASSCALLLIYKQNKCKKHLTRNSSNNIQTIKVSKSKLHYLRRHNVSEQERAMNQRISRMFGSNLQSNIEMSTYRNFKFFLLKINNPTVYRRFPTALLHPFLTSACKKNPKFTN